MHVQHLLSSNVAQASATTGAISVARQVSERGVVELNPILYSLLAVALALVGVWLARQVTIGEENKKLGRKQTWRETGPLTWIGILIVGPMIWHFDVAIVWAPMIGLGVGYSVRLVLKILGGGAVDAARAIAKRAAASLDEEREPIHAPQPPATLLDAPGARPPATILPPDKPSPLLERRMKQAGDALDALPDVTPHPKPE